MTLVTGLDYLPDNLPGRAPGAVGAVSTPAGPGFAQHLEARLELSQLRISARGANPSAPVGMPPKVVSFIDGPMFGEAITVATGPVLSEAPAVGGSQADATNTSSGSDYLSGSETSLSGPGEFEAAPSPPNAGLPLSAFRPLNTDLASSPATVSSGKAPDMRALQPLPEPGAMLESQGDSTTSAERGLQQLLNVPAAPVQSSITPIAEQRISLTPIDGRAVSAPFSRRAGSELLNPGHSHNARSLSAALRAEFARQLGPVNVTLRQDGSKLAVIARVSGLQDEQAAELLRELPALAADADLELGEVHLNGRANYKVGKVS